MQFFEDMKRVYPDWNVGNNESLMLKDLETLPNEIDDLEEFFPRRRMNEPELSIDHEFDFEDPSHDLHV